MFINTFSQTRDIFFEMVAEISWWFKGKICFTGTQFSDDSHGSYLAKS